MNLDRIARNQLLVLKNESYFDKVNNPADGSYYIETLTAQLAEKALVLFKISKLMVVFKQLNEGRRNQRKSRKVPTKNKAFDSGKEISLELINTQTKTTE
jgi:methylmalonyl-CoA mutase